MQSCNSFWWIRYGALSCLKHALAYELLTSVLIDIKEQFRAVALRNAKGHPPVTFAIAAEENAAVMLAANYVFNVKVIRNKQNGQSDGYGFIEFANRSAAENIPQTYNGTPMPNGAQNIRLNWASAGEKRSDDTPDYTIFVGDLASDVTDYMLQETFRARFSSVKGAKVVIDRLTGRTKGYGFVRFGDETEQLRAMTKMNGVICSTRPMTIGPAANKNVAGSQQYTKGS
ncbi:hypothetical protein FNV43_RR00373 [Rhamnella rubrinervis]|uniref:RRM domain-containing protein n=1 Tax=Rhamnella rubrinervis TaxID=2594499 RepID=A0A8K0HMQ0_9ROSA|nr:hypothetical protein FNV43_RR00373 [Rhamnella rubrinervis]